MTPAEHRTAATEINDTLEQRYGSAFDAADGAQAIAEAHAHLAQAAGTGQEYADAEAAIVAAEQAASSSGVWAKKRLARQAVLLAILADRA